MAYLINRPRKELHESLTCWVGDNELYSLTSLLEGHALKQVRLHPGHETGNGFNLAERLVGGHSFS